MVAPGRGCVPRFGPGATIASDQTPHRPGFLCPPAAAQTPVRPGTRIAHMTASRPFSTSALVSGALMLLRSEEHTSELQSLMRISYAVFCLKKKNNTNYTEPQYNNHNNYNTRLLDPSHA